MVRLLTKASLGLLAVGLQCAAVSAKNIFHFGDSYSATGFDTSKSMPSKANPIGNPDFPGNSILGIGTANWVGMFLKDNAKSGPMFFNYADFGACVNQSTEGCDTNNHRDLGAQYSAYRSHQDVIKGSEDVVSMYFGTNDINAQGNTQTRISTIISYMVDTMALMYGDGMRNFVLFGMDPLYRTPGNTVEGKPQTGVVASAYGVLLWNLELAVQLDGFRSRHPDAKVAAVSSFDAFSKVLDDPAGHGAPDNTCLMKNGNQNCLWYDDLHPGVAIQKELAAQYANALKSIGFL